jgi:hypothetical protein
LIVQGKKPVSMRRLKVNLLLPGGRGYVKAGEPVPDDVEISPELLASFAIDEDADVEPDHPEPSPTSPASSSKPARPAGTVPLAGHHGLKRGKHRAPEG